MRDFKKESCERFTALLASESPVPGGGGAAALVGAVGTALGNMVGSLTLGKKKYADVQEDIERLNGEAGALQAELLELITRDAEVFEPLSRAYGLPKDTPEALAEKERVMEQALRECCEVPLRLMALCGRAIELHGEYEKKGSAIAISDVGCGVACCSAALRSASLNVYINTKSMKDRAFAEEANARAAALISKYVPLADEIFARVEERFH